jgi:SAM-dependent methyltransferase
LDSATLTRGGVASSANMGISSRSHGGNRLKDTINALRVYNGKPHVEWAELSHILKAAKRGDAEFDGMKLRRFMNGNAHLFFGPVALAQVNSALAEYYGEVLPDCPEERPAKAKGTAVAKDLQFYRTPAEVADHLVSLAGPRTGSLILEPSCGDGAILDAIRRCAQEERRDLRAVGIEYDAGRAAQASAKGHAVQVANFLQVQPDPRFDLVLMNPPFYGKHYQQHVEHARKFLKPDGRVLAILPITAMTDHGYIQQRRWMRDWWVDLPVGSFSESGTNINTGIATFFA